MVLLLLWGLSLFGSAFCLFWGQLLLGKLLLPLWGGSPWVWNTCLAFFQAVLFLGYLWADGLGRRLSPRGAVLFHGVLLLTGLVLTGPGQLPLRDLIGLQDQGGELGLPWALLAHLTSRVGLPLLLLSATTPLLQQATREKIRDPYGLYVASNGGSLAGLLGYPLLLEPRLPLDEQSRLWTATYVLVAVLLLLGGVGLPAQRREPIPAGRIPWREGWRWAGLAFLPAGLLVAVTTLLTTDVAAVPLLWALPLGIYLVTFMLAFGGIFPNGLLLGITAFLACGAVAAQLVGLVRPGWVLLPLHLTVFGLVAWGCHSQLARCRPPAERLTQFYLWLALGGGLGGMFSALLAPQVFETVLEYPLLLGLSLPVLAAQGGRVGLWLGLGLTLPLGLLRFRWQALLQPGSLLGLALGWGVLAGMGIGWRRRIPWAGVTAGLVLLLGQPWLPPGLAVLHSERSAFGLNRIVEYRNALGSFRSLVHGTTLHGTQKLAPGQAPEPLTYFSRAGPVGQVFRQWRAQPRSAPAQVAVLGLGIGTLAAYAEPGDEWTFFELDPTVADWARRYFSYLVSYLDQAQVQVILGDARLSLQRIPDGRYDLLVMDAFSSDAVPVHLLTQEALELYLRKLRPQGWLLVNITNRHLDLAPVVARLASQLGLFARHKLHRDLSPAQRLAGLAPSHWVLMARNPQALQGLAPGDPWQPLLPQAGDPLWRDDFSNLLQLIRWPQLPGPVQRAGSEAKAYPQI